MRLPSLFKKSGSKRSTVPARAGEVWPKVLAVRAACQQNGSFSWTSLRYQNDALRFLLQNAGQGGCVIEVGCYNGGLSVQLALVASHLSLPFYTMDIDENAVIKTRELLSGFGHEQGVTVFHGGLTAFAGQFHLPDRAALIVIDGDHSYAGARDDIQAFNALSHYPFAAVFHDYCLRSPHTDERVNEAVADELPQAVLIPIGSSPDEDASMPTIERPSPDGHYWLSPGTEGCIAILQESQTR